MNAGLVSLEDVVGAGLTLAEDVVGADLVLAEDVVGGWRLRKKKWGCFQTTPQLIGGVHVIHTLPVSSLYNTPNVISFHGAQGPWQRPCAHSTFNLFPSRDLWWATVWGRGTSDGLLCGGEGPLMGDCVGERDLWWATVWGRGTSDGRLCGGEGPLMGYCVGERDLWWATVWGRGTSDGRLCGGEGPLMGDCVGERDLWWATVWGRGTSDGRLCGGEGHSLPCHVISFRSEHGRKCTKKKCPPLWLNFCHLYFSGSLSQSIQQFNRLFPVCRIHSHVSRGVKGDVLWCLVSYGYSCHAYDRI